MASLTEALGASALRTAFCDVTATTRVVAREEIDGRQPGSATGYTVTVQRGAGLPQKLNEVPTVEEALSQMRALGLAGFDAEHAEWQPATSATGTSSARWADEAESQDPS